LGAAVPDYVPDPNDYAGLRGDRSNRWGQDREMMKAGHWTGFGRTLLEEDVAVQTSMGPIVDRSKENLSASDVAVVQARSTLLEALDSFQAGGIPTGSALTPDGVLMPNASEFFVDGDQRWQNARSSLSGPRRHQDPLSG
jgi:LigXa C-terminal domain like